MKLETIGKGFTYRWPGGEARFEPGRPVDLPPERAAKLLARAAERVRPVPTDSIVIEPAAQDARPVFWETAKGQILGPAVPECLAQDGDDFWIGTTYDGQPRWIRSDRLRSFKAFLEQTEVKEVEPIRF